MTFKDTLNKWTDITNNALEKYIIVKDTPESTIYKAMKYSLAAGGKRLRPILAFSVCELLDGDVNEILPFACAIEMIHTYSLIHDDLPAMDNDDFRRGMHTNHKVFGEAIAILAGDALLNYAFETMLQHTLEDKKRLLERVKAMRIIARASGAEGMIGGQVVDLESEKKSVSSDILEYMHQCKTGALINAPILAASVLCNANKEQTAFLSRYASNIGLAFQIKDDIMDVEGSFENMGKTIGKDNASMKSTFVTIHGIEKAKEMLESSIKNAVEAITPFGGKATILEELAYYIQNRDK